MSTIKDIAKVLGLSTSTVSRALNNSYGIKEKTKCIVLEKAKEMNYHPNEMARGLVYKKSRTIGLIIRDIADPTFAENAKGIEQICAKNNFSVIYYNTNRKFSVEMDAVNDVQKRQVDGIIITPDFLDGEHINNLIKNNFPFVMLRRSTTRPDVSFVDSDNIYGTDLIMNHLIELGHRNFGLITLSAHSFSSNIRLKRCIEIFKENGIEMDNRMVVEGNYDEESGYKGFDRLFDEIKPTAIFAFTDRMAVGAFLRAKERNIRVPEDISIIGFDGINIGQIGYIGLTTACQDSYRMGQKAANILFNKIINKDELVKQIFIKPDLIIGKTTGISKNLLL